MTKPPKETPAGEIPSGKIRINRLLSRYGLCSRRKADEWIAAGRVAIDGMVCMEVGVEVDPNTQRVAVDGKPLGAPPTFRYIALYKPAGVLTSCGDPHGRKTVMDLLPQELRGAGLFPVGRLDLDSEGLIILTNDGEWAGILAHPSHQIKKRYWVQIDRVMKLKNREQLERGVLLDGKRTLPARIHVYLRPPHSGKAFTIELKEGRNRQIRRMCSKIQCNVLALKRLEVGPVQLGHLKPGEWRDLDAGEIEKIRRLAVTNRPA